MGAHWFFCGAGCFVELGSKFNKKKLHGADYGFGRGLRHAGRTGAAQLYTEPGF